MDKLSREQILDILARVEAELLRIRVARQPQLLANPLTLLQQLDAACQDVLPRASYEHYQENLATLQSALAQVVQNNDRKVMNDVVQLTLEIINTLYEEMKKDPCLQRAARAKKEVLFLPYKSSMWDSMDSIWRSMSEDSRFHVYVIPLPYADRNKDGTAKEWHLEIDMFPKDVPVIDYREFDIEALHPDAIFVHNPYDQYNTATSVDSMYYSGNLRKWTDLLVYVPYFAVAKRWPEMHTQLPIYQNMDFMIVQKEHMQIAPMQFSKIKENDIRYLEDYIPAEKLVPLGSPKIDKIFYCEQHPDVPQEWLDYIAGRKVIFYNTSISGILQQGERFLNKMAYIFSVFSKRDDVVLLWRPHPLMDSCIQSVRPELYEGYAKLRQQFIDTKLGIYDDTPDMDMTIAICDAYLGEGSSSVVSMFGYAGKPIFFTGDWMLWREPTLEEKAALHLGTHIYDEKYSYFQDWAYNRFCRMERATGKIEDLLDFGNTPDSKGYSCFMRDEDDRKFYFSPGSAKSICIYDEATGERQDIPFDDPLEGGNFAGILRSKRYLFFLPSRYPAMLRLDKETGELTYLRECLEEILPTVTAEHMELLGPAAWISYPNLLYLPALQSNRVMTFNMETCEYSWQAVGPEDTDCSCMIEEQYGCGIFWLFPWRTTKLRRWNTHTGEVEVLDESAYPPGYQCQTDWWNFKDQYKFSCILRLDGYIWLLPAYGNMAMRLNMAEKKLEQVDLHLPFGWEERKSNYFMYQSPLLSLGGPWIPGYRPWNEDLPERVLQMTYDRKLYWYNFRTGEYRVQDCSLTDEQAQVWATPIADSFERCGLDIPYATGESRSTRSISQYIDYVCEGRHDRAKQREAWSELANNVDGTCGEKVKEEVLRRLG